MRRAFEPARHLARGRQLLATIALAGLWPLTACHGPATPLPGGASAQPWQELLDGTGLAGWDRTAFGGEGAVTCAAGVVQLDFGSPLTGITWTGAAPTDEYELEVVAARVAGQDFFAAITFPVGATALTLVLGGWGGTVCGLSQLDGLDAAYNPTRCLRSFERLRRYTAGIRVTADRIEVTLDGEPLCAVPRQRVALSLRAEMLPCQPLGIAAYNTQAQIHRVRWRRLGPPPA
jgi:hypothetical protein